MWSTETNGWPVYYATVKIQYMNRLSHWLQYIKILPFSEIDGGRTTARSSFFSSSAVNLRITATATLPLQRRGLFKRTRASLPRSRCIAPLLRRSAQSGTLRRDGVWPLAMVAVSHIGEFEFGHFLLQVRVSFL